MSALGAHLDPRALADRAPRSPGPWTSDFLVGLLVANGVGLVLVFVGWWESAGLGRAHDQLAWLNLSVLGLVISGGANGLWLARGRRVVTMARSMIWPDSRGLSPTWQSAGPLGSNGHAPVGVRPHRRPADTGTTRGGSFVASSTMSFYHRADCPLVAGKQVTVASRPEHEAGGRRPCEVCSP